MTDKNANRHPSAENMGRFEIRSSPQVKLCIQILYFVYINLVLLLHCQCTLVAFFRQNILQGMS